MSGMNVVEAKDGKMALDYLGVQVFGLVILDIMLPFISGWELCKVIKEKVNMPVLFF